MQSIFSLCERAVNSKEVSEDVKSEILYLLCCMGSDAPSFAVKWLLEHTKTPAEINDHRHRVAYAIGNASLQWQKDLLRMIVSVPGKKIQTPPPSTEPEKKSILSKLTDMLKAPSPKPEQTSEIEVINVSPNIMLSVLAIVVWRSEQLIYSLTPEEWLYITTTLCARLNNELKRLTKADGKIGDPYDLLRMLELTLALLRSRKDNRKEVRMILAPNTELADKFSELIETIAKTVIKHKEELKSFVEIEIPDKPQAFREWPDILYALHAYFDSESSSAGSIKITGFAET